MASSNSQLAMTNEDQPLLERKPSYFRILKTRYRNTHKCISSKAALLILFWSFVVYMIYTELFFSGFVYIQAIGIHVNTTIIFNGGNALVFIFCPLAGFLADVKFSRYKTIVTSLYIMLPSVILMIVAEGLAIPDMYCSYVKEEACSTVQFWIGIGLFFICEVVLMLGFVGFIANVFQFGLDQLHDMPGEGQSLFIHWIVWIYYLSRSIPTLIFIGIPTSYFKDYFTIAITLVLPLVLTLLLIGLLCVAHCKKRWFIIDPMVVNPYKLVYKITKFALQHKIPVRRSAFTYCEDELPSGLDLGKNKYGGPFTTEQVEDVKTFYGIAKVLFSFGTVFLYSLGASNTAKIFSEVNSFNYTLIVDLPPLLMYYPLPVIGIPLYICLIRPIFSYYIPGMLKRMGIGMLLLLISLIYSASLDTAYYFDSYMGTNVSNFSSAISISPQDMYFSIVIPQVMLESLANMILPIAVLEFICSQSPRSMKGLFIGLLIANYGLYWFISVFLLQLKFKNGLVYYIVNIIMGVIFFVIFVFIAKKYKYRERDEPSNERRYAEEYYSKLVDESNMED